MLFNDSLDEFLPLTWENSLSQVLLLRFIKARVLNSIQAQLLQVTDAELPGSECDHIVHGHALISKEARVIT